MNHNHNREIISIPISHYWSIVIIIIIIYQKNTNLDDA
jgi:hypothetical protein